MRIWLAMLIASLGEYTGAQSVTLSTDSLRLVFEDDFDRMDTAKWVVANEFDHYGEPQVYTCRAENVAVNAGNLELSVRKEPYNCGNISPWSCTKTEYCYTSGWVETKNCKPKFGYIESRIKIPHGQGLWPAFWTYVADGAAEAKNAAEIDIFEMLGNLPPTQMSTNLHLRYCNALSYDWDGASQSCSDLSDYGEYMQIPDYSEQFHTYGLQWTPAMIRWFVDGAQVRASDNPGITDQVRLILNVAILPWSLPDDSTPFPSKMLIDNVRVYEYQHLDELQIIISPDHDAVQISTCNFITSIRVVSVLGTEIFSRNDVNSYSVSVPVVDWASGLYVFMVESDYHSAVQKIYVD